MPEHSMDSQEQQSEGFSGVDEEYQYTEEFIREQLGLDEVSATAAEDEAAGTTEGTQTEVEETPQQEEAVADADYQGVVQDTPTTPDTGLVDTSAEGADAVQAPSIMQSPEVRMMIDQQRQLQKLLAEREAELVEYRRRQEEAALGDEQFISEEDDMDTILTSPVAFNALLNKVYKKGIATGKEHVMRSFDQQLDSKVRVHIDRRARAEQFFHSNPELSSPKIREYVFLVGQELAEAHPEWSVDTFYANLGPEIKTRLGLAAAERANPAAMPRKTGRPAVSGMNKAGMTRPPSKRGVRALADEVSENLGL